MKTIGIEAFLSWAYREELPKAVSTGAMTSTGYASMWGAMQVASEGIMGSDGRPNDYGVIASTFVVTAPHIDAIRAHEAVVGLDAWEPGLPEEWDPLSDLGLNDIEREDAVRRARPRIIREVNGEARYRQRPAELIRHHAIMRSTPCWEAEVPKARFVCSHGKPVWFRKVRETIRGVEFEREVDGFNRKAQRPFPGAYRKTFLTPDPALAAVERAEYEVWQAALCALTDVLNEPGYLSAHTILGPAAQQRPWETPQKVSETA